MVRRELLGRPNRHHQRADPARALPALDARPQLEYGLGADESLAKRSDDCLWRDWQPVVTLSPGLHHSPHYRYHGAINQIKELEICWDFGKMTSAAREETARRVLRLWQQTGRCWQAGEYIQSVWERALDADKKGIVIDVSDLPGP